MPSSGEQSMDMQETNNMTLLHASALVIGHTGLLIRGPSGSGKSHLQRILRQKARELGLFSALVSDDYVHITPSPDGTRLIGHAPMATQKMQEVRGLGLVSLPDGECFEPVARLNLLLDLVPMADMERMPSTQSSTICLLGVTLAHLSVPINEGLIAQDILFTYLSTSQS